VAIVLLGDDFAPPSGHYYLRQEVLSRLSGVRLVPTRSDGLDADVLRRFPTHLETLPGMASGSGEVLVHGDVALLVDHEAPFALVRPTAYAQLPNPNP